MALDLASKAAIRRHLRLPAAGIGVQGQTYGVRAVFQGVSQLEQYMIALQLEEESIIRGVPYGAFLVQTGNQVGDVLTVTINSTTYTYHVQPSDLIPTNVSSTSGNIAANIASLINQNPVAGVMVAAGAIANPVVPSIALPTANQVSCLSVGGAVFNLSVSGPCMILLQNGTSYPFPQLPGTDGAGNTTYTYGLLPVCNALESALLGASQNLSVSSVGSTATGAINFRPDELYVRSGLLEAYRHELGVMLSYYPYNGPNATDGGSGRILV